MRARPFLRLAATCLVAFPLGACAPAGLAPLPTAAAPDATPAAPEAAGDVGVRLGLALPAAGAAARRLLYTGDQIESLDVTLYWLDGVTPRQVQAATLDAAQIQAGPTVAFAKLKRDRTYVAVATAYRTIGGVKTPISDDAASRLTFAIAHPQDQLVTITQKLPVALLDTPAPDFGAATDLAVTPGTTRAPEVAGTLTANAIVAPVALTTEGSKVKVSWTSRGAGVTDYDVAVAFAGDQPTVRATGVDPEAGTSHVRTFELGTAPTGSYEATVSIKGKPGSAYVVAGTLVAPIANVALTYAEGYARVGWTSAGALEADYDVTIENAGGSVVFSDVAADARKGTSHFVRFALGSTAFGTYTARVRLKDRPATERVHTAQFANTVTAVTLAYTGSDATIGWNSHVALATDYVLEILDASDAVVETRTVTGRTGTYNTATVPMGAAASGSYKARVRDLALAATAKTSAAKAYTAPVVAPDPTGPANLVIAGDPGWFSVNFTGLGGSQAYTFKVYRAATPGTPSVADAPYKTFTKTLSGTTLEYARYIHGTASEPFDPNYNYQIEIYVGSTLISTSDVAPYLTGVDPIIGNCTIVPEPNCEFVAPTTPGVIEE